MTNALSRSIWALGRTAKRHILNASGWRTEKKIVVIESDDWGSVRMASSRAADVLRSRGLPVDRCHYMSFDALASDDDLTALFETLVSVRADDGSHPALTANALVANPDFERIAASAFREYHHEPLPETLGRYPAHRRAWSLWKEGMRERLFHPQLHGREHLNTPRWLSALQVGLPETTLAFQLGVFGVSTTVSSEQRGSFMAALDLVEPNPQESLRQVLEDAVSRFEHLFGYPSRSFIAPNYVWDDRAEAILDRGGVRYLQGSRVQQMPTQGGRRIRRSHYLGERNCWRQVYLVRNCHFEPSSAPAKDWVSSCLREIHTAFIWKKPAIISSHRVNYVGFIDQRNRQRNLPRLLELLRCIVRRWPDVRFLTSDQLGALIDEDEAWSC